MQPVMERSHPTSGRPATPADINRNGRPTSIGTSGRHQSECPADIIGMRKPRGNVDAVAEDVAILDDDVTRPVRTYPLRTSTAHSEPVLMIFTRMPPRRTHLGTKAFDR